MSMQASKVEIRKCSATRSDGTPCGNPPKKGSKFCRWHQTAAEPVSSLSACCGSWGQPRMANRRLTTHDSKMVSGGLMVLPALEESKRHLWEGRLKDTLAEMASYQASLNALVSLGERSPEGEAAPGVDGWAPISARKGQ
jgi:hypothetical protein